MLSRFSTKAVVLVLMGSLLIPSAFLSYPAKTEAASTCASVVAGAVAAAVGLSATAKVIGVTVSAPGGDAAGIVGAGASYGSFFQDCVLKPIAVRLAKAMLQNVTGSIIAWINSGFHGSPSFVQDLHGLIQDTTDMAIGEFIDRDLRAGFLCSPFSLQVRIAVAQTYLPYHQRYSCTLSQIEDNVTGFANGNNRGGWDTWLQTTVAPQNNVYGATVLAQNELSRQIAQRLEVQNRELDWGKGFRSWSVCTETYDGSDPSNLDPASENCAGAETRTPGTVVESQLEVTLGSGVRQLEVADDIDAIVGALTNQMMLQVVNGAKGLLGAGKKSNGSGNSATYGGALGGGSIDPALMSAYDSGVSQLTDESDIDGAFLDSNGANYLPLLSGTGTPDVTDDSAQPLSITLSIDDKTSVTSVTTPFLFVLRIAVNKHATNMRVTSTLRSKANNAFVPFSGPFSDFRIATGRSDGTSISTYPTNGEWSETWSNVSADENSPYILKFSGTVRTASRSSFASMPGTYVIDTSVSDGEGGAKNFSTEFTVQ